MTDPTTAPDARVDEDGATLQSVTGPAHGIGRAVRLFATGALGGFLTLVGLGVMAEPHSHRCCGATGASVVQKKERQRRCMELGITMDELDRLEPAAPVEE
jgi:hypothetical protein